MSRKVILALALSMSACQPTYMEEPRTEQGSVLAMTYMPAGHGSGSGLSSSGSAVFTTIHIPERYAVVFQCEHGSFVVEGDTARALFSTLTQGMAVTISYRRECAGAPQDGECIPTDLDFLNAEPTP